MNDAAFVIGKFSDICEVIDREYADSVSIVRLCHVIKANLTAVKDGGQSLENSTVMDDIEDLFGEVEQYDFQKVDHKTEVMDQIRFLVLIMGAGKANQEQYDEGLAEVKSNEGKGYTVRDNNVEVEDDECEYDVEDDEDMEPMTFSEILHDFDIQFEDSMEFLKSVVKMLAHIPADQHNAVGLKLTFLGLGLAHANNPVDFEALRASIAHIVPAAPEKEGNVTKLTQRQTKGGARITMFDLPKGMDF